MKDNRMNFRHAMLGGLVYGAAGLAGLAVASPLCVIAYRWLANDAGIQGNRDMRLWIFLSFPGVVVIPLLLFFTGFVVSSGRGPSRFAATLVILAVTAIPWAGVLAALGMSPPRYRSIQHPPMYLSEVLMFLIPMAIVSYLLMFGRWTEPESSGSSHQGTKAQSTAGKGEKNEARLD